MTPVTDHCNGRYILTIRDHYRGRTPSTAVGQIMNQTAMQTLQSQMNQHSVLEKNNYDRQATTTIRYLNEDFCYYDAVCTSFDMTFFIGLCDASRPR